MLLVVGVSGAHGPRVKVVRGCHSRARETVSLYRRGRRGLLGVVLLVDWAGVGVVGCSQLRWLGALDMVVVVVRRRQLRAARRAAARRAVHTSTNVVLARQPR